MTEYKNIRELMRSDEFLNRDEGVTVGDFVNDYFKGYRRGYTKYQHPLFNEKLPTRLIHALIKAGYRDINEVFNDMEKYTLIEDLPNIGKKSMAELQEYKNLSQTKGGKDEYRR